MTASHLYADLFGNDQLVLSKQSIIDFAERYHLAKKAEETISPSQTCNDSYFQEKVHSNLSVNLGVPKETPY